MTGEVNVLITYLHAKADPDCSVLRTRIPPKKVIGLWKWSFCTTAAINSASNSLHVALSQHPLPASYLPFYRGINTGQFSYRHCPILPHFAAGKYPGPGRCGRATPLSSSSSETAELRGEANGTWRHCGLDHARRLDAERRQSRQQSSVTDWRCSHSTLSLIHI